MGQTHDYDYLIVGSGFGGSVSALRLAEKGYRVNVLESGRRFRGRPVRRAALAAAPDGVCAEAGLEGHPAGHTVQRRRGPHRQWRGRRQPGLRADPVARRQRVLRGLARGMRRRPRLEKYYELAEGMLGVVTQPRRTPADEAIEAIAAELGVADTFRPVPVGVYFGEPGVVDADPYFGGAGPARSGCIECGLCLLGCRNNTKRALEERTVVRRAPRCADRSRTHGHLDPAVGGGGRFRRICRDQRTHRVLDSQRQPHADRAGCRRGRRCAGNQSTTRPM